MRATDVETKPSGLVYFNPYSEEEFRVYLPEGDHVFRAGFIGDQFVKILAGGGDAYRRDKEQVPRRHHLHRTLCLKTEKESRKKILSCNPDSGSACVERILTHLARRAYRRPPTRSEVDSLLRFVALAKARGQSAEQGVQLAIQAMLVSPNFLFRIERDPNPRDPALVHEVSHSNWPPA